MTAAPPDLILEADVVKRWPIPPLELRRARRERRIGFYAIGRRHYYTPAQIAAYLEREALQEPEPCPDRAPPTCSNLAPIGSATTRRAAPASGATGMTPDLEESAALAAQARILRRSSSNSPN